MSRTSTGIPTGNAAGSTSTLAILNTCLLAIIVCQLGVALYFLKAPSDQARKLTAAVADLERGAAGLKDATQRALDQQATDAASLVPYRLRPGQMVTYGSDVYRVVRATGSGEDARIVGVRQSDGQLFGLRPDLCEPIEEEGR